MNLWIPRGPSARAEAKIMSAAVNWYISTKTSGPVNGEIQDSIVGCYELTRSGVRIDKYHAMGLFAMTGLDPPRFDEHDPKKLYTGRDIVSLLLSRFPVNYTRAPKSFSEVYAPYIQYDENEILTVLEQGRLIRGVLDADSVGDKKTGSIFHLISREYGPRHALDMICALQQIALQFLLYRGFTVGMADLLPSPEAAKQIRALVSSVLLESQVITDRLLRGEIVPPIGLTVHEFYERLQLGVLKVNESEILRWILGSIHPETNGFFRMIEVGSKGKNPNLIQIIGAIGQTTINTERIREHFAFRRTHPYFPRFSVDPAAYGFVGNSYMNGMSSSEDIYQGMNGRHDIISKALVTASTGYFMRKSVMNNQSSIVDNHRHITKDTRVVQFIYGEDGLDSREFEKVNFRTVAMSEADLQAAGADLAGALGSAAERAEAQAAIDRATSRIREDRDAYRQVFMRIEDSNFGQTFATQMLMPVNVGRIVDGVFIAAQNAARPPLTAAGLRARIETVQDLCDRIAYTLVNEIQERRRTPVAAHKRAAAGLLCMLIRAELCPRVLARLSDEQLSYIIDVVRQRYGRSLIDYGTAVGILAAQAVSEPLTQYMLDSHHRSVSGGTNKAGLVRVSEIYGARPVSDEQSPAMQLPLRKEVLGEKSGAFGVAQEIANSVEYVTFRRFVRRYEIILEPYDELVYPPHLGDRAWITEFEQSNPLVHLPTDLTNWCFRFVLDKSALVLKAVELELVIRCLRARHPGAHVVHTHGAVPEVVVRVWNRLSQFKRGGDYEDRARELFENTLDTPIRGIKGVIRATAEKITRRTVAAGGEPVKSKNGKERVAQAGELIEEDRHVIMTVGTNLYNAVLHGAVDQVRAISTSIGDTAKLLGIEAARAKIISETCTFMAESTPNLRHLYLYADEMTRTGRVTSVERGGLGSREHNNVLLRMAYGAPIQAVTEATLAGARGKVYGLAAPKLLGSIPQIGTVYNSVVVDDEFVHKNVKSVDTVLNEL